MPQNRDAAGSGHKFLEQFETFGSQFAGEG
jgi:hypothetical protein